MLAEARAHAAVNRIEAVDFVQGTAEEVAALEGAYRPAWDWPGDTEIMIAR